MRFFKKKKKDSPFPFKIKFGRTEEKFYSVGTDLDDALRVFNDFAANPDYGIVTLYYKGDLLKSQNKLMTRCQPSN